MEDYLEPLSSSPDKGRLICLICFGSQTGVKRGDHLVQSENGHVFHFCCLRVMMSTDDGGDGCSICPACDEDLRHQTIYPIPTATHVVETVGRTGLLNQRAQFLAVGNAGNGRQSNQFRREESRVQGGRGAEPWNVVVRPATMNISPDFTFKIAILGNLGVGKSALLRRFADEAFNPNIQSTIGCDLRVKKIEIGNKFIELKLWDTAGQERYRQSIVGSYLRNTDGIILCYDITCMDSLASIHEWHEFALKYAPEKVMKIMVGSKLDLWNSTMRVVEADFVSNVSNHLRIPNIYCSAKDATNVEAVFRSITCQILEQRIVKADCPTEDHTIKLKPGRKSHIKKIKACCDI